MGRKGLFLIRSPFQMLCALEAIRDFCLSDYTIWVITDGNLRVDQIKRICERYSVSFKLIKFQVETEGSFARLLSKALFAKDGHYDYVFVGDFREIEETLFSLTFTSKGANIVYLDDGNVTISLFSGTLSRSKKSIIKASLLRLIFAIKGHPTPTYYTIYSDYPTNLKTISCSLQSIRYSNNSDLHNCFFVGTNSIEYINSVGIVRDKYLCNLRSVLKELKNNQISGEECYYIPHGADALNDIEGIVKHEGFHYLPISECVEFYFSKLDYIPRVIGGFGSSALYTAKIMFPESRVLNYQMIGSNDDFKNELQAINQFYEQKGIENLIYG